VRSPAPETLRHRALLVDLDGVIRHWRMVRDEAIETAHGLPPGGLRRAAFAPGLVGPAITGRVSDETWRSNIAASLERAHGAPNAATAVAAWSAHPGEVDEAALAIVRACAASLRVVLVTNATSRLGADLQTLGLAGLFHAVVNSSEVGVAKPAARIFQVALDRAGVPAAQALFVDDTEANVLAASALGITSHRFTGDEALRSFLRGHGLA